MTPVFEASEDFAKRLDERDPLARFRERFALPTRHGEPVVYFNGNSLGLMPLAARELVAGRARRLGRARGRRAFLGKDAVVFVSRGASRALRALGRRRTRRGRRDERADGESPPDDGDVLPADRRPRQDPDRRRRVPFRHLRRADAARAFTASTPRQGLIRVGAALRRGAPSDGRSDRS